MISNVRHFLRLQRPEVDLHAAGTQGGRNFGWAAGGRAYQTKIRRKPILEHVMNISGDGSVLRTVVGGFQHHLAVFQHFEQLVHLDGMQLADLIQKQHAAVRLGDGSRLGLGHSLHAQRPGPLIDGIVNAADQRVGDGSLVEADAGGVHLDKGCVGTKGRAGALLRGFQHQTGGAGLADARRPVDDDMLRVFAAQDRFQGFDPVLLTYDIRKFRRAHLLRQGLAEAQRPHFLQLFQFPPAVPAVGRLRFLLGAELGVEINSHDARYQQLNSKQNHADQSKTPNPIGTFAVPSVGIM